MHGSSPRDGVLHVITDPRRRGAQTFAYDLHHELRARGTASRIVALAPDPPAPPAPNEPPAPPAPPPARAPGAHDLPVRTLGSRRLGRDTLSALRHEANGHRVVVAHGSSTLPACALALAFARIPFVYVSIGDPRHWAPTRLRRLRVGLMLRRAEAVASVSALGRELLLRHYGLPPDRVRSIPNGRRPEAYPRVDAASRAAARAQLGVPDDAVVLAVVGALGPEKRVDVAIEAFARLAADPPTRPGGELLLLIAGDGALRGRLTDVAAELAPGRVRFLGTVDDAGPVYRAADALLLTSDSEGVPGVLVEAGLSGIPAVATDVGFVRDVVLDARTGALVAPGDPAAVAAGVRRVLADAATLGAAAHGHCVGTYAMASVVDAWQELLEGIAAPTA
ncbi:glycosyltransferase [Yinghuangia sp. ASG 101]|uniref:glycosyltransferase n=1 Tax=Yinghuangia sp. ASG 101 TaxID=2896848 RepID=UPI001E54B0FD|nr:glycosyltransferase [Yinghuangia sp. ASG 101]UGQ10573.1 glycosyltransferase [Yinghuangia sp. ASG 101]